MATRAPDYTCCKCLLITDTNLLDNTFEARSDRAMLRALAATGVVCEAIGRWAIYSDKEIEPATWLDERGWEKGKGGFAIPEEFIDAIRASDGNVPITQFRGSSTRPHALDEAEKKRFLRLIELALDRVHCAVTVVR